MKKLLLILGLGLWGITSVQALDTGSPGNDDRGTAGKAVNAVGHGVKEAGKGIGNGASWTWDHIKHNKLTKNVFNQPGDEDYAKANQKDVTQEAKEDVGNAAHDVKKETKKAGNEIDEHL